MQFMLVVDMDNAAFDSPQELSRILRDIAASPAIESPEDGNSGTYRDSNGNTTASWSFSGERT